MSRATLHRCNFPYSLPAADHADFRESLTVSNISFEPAENTSGDNTQTNENKEQSQCRCLQGASQALQMVVAGVVEKRCSSTIWTAVQQTVSLDF